MASHTDILKKNYAALAKSLLPERILTPLFTCEVIIAKEWEQLERTLHNKGQTTAAEELLQILLRDPNEQHFWLFTDILRETNQDELYRQLKASAEQSGLKYSELVAEKSPFKDAGLIFCKEHKNEIIKFHCDECIKPICIVCKVTVHDRHLTQTMEKALEQIEKNTEYIHGNIDKMQAQIQGIDNKIEAVIEDFAAGRDTMDNRLELMSKTLKAIKDKQETVMTEQESSALDTLQKTKTALENQLSEAKQLTHDVKTCTNKTTLLTEFSDDIVLKLKEHGKFKLETVKLKLPVAHFAIEEENFEEVLSKMFSLQKNEVFTVGGMGSKDEHKDDKNDELKFTDGAMGSEDGHMCENFYDVFKNPVKREKQVALAPSWHNRISKIDNKIVVPANEKREIEIFNTDSASLNEVIDTDDNNIFVVKKAHNSDLITAGLDGLFITNSEFSTWRQVAEGKFSDVVIHENKFSALRYDDPCVMTFSLEPIATQAENNTDWEMVSTFQIENKKKLKCNDSLGICGNHYFVALTSNRYIHKYRLDGTLVSAHTKSLSWNPRICGSDRRGKLLIGNFSHGTLHVLDSASGEMSLVQDIGVKLVDIRDLVIDDEQNLWCLQGDKGQYKLVKYSTKP